MRDEQTLKKELLSQWKLEAEFRNLSIVAECFIRKWGFLGFGKSCTQPGLKIENRKNNSVEGRTNLH